MASYAVSFGSRAAIFIEKEPGVLHRKESNDLFPAVLSLEQAKVDYKVERLAHFTERTATESQATFLREEQCELMFGFTQKQDYAKYALALLALKAQVEKELKDAGHLYTVTTQKGRINILTHRQASEYNRRRFTAKKKSMRKSHRLLAVVDTSHLSAEEREEHERHLLRQGREIQALDKVKQQFRATPHVSDIPRMVTS